MRIAIVGVGCIGSVVASHLARAGHAVTLVARGARRRSLAEHGLRVRAHGSRRVEVLTLPVLDDVAAAGVELIVVCTQMQQVEPLLPALARHTANVCMLMNVNPVPASWSVLGERLILGFPAMLAGYRDDVVAYRTLPGWLRFAMINTLGPARGGEPKRARDVVRLFNAAGLATTFDADMPSWLATHSALVTGLSAYSAARSAARRSLAMSWQDAFTVARALHEGLALVRASGARLAPTNVALLRFAPSAAIASTMWSLSRLPMFERAVLDYAEHGQHEIRAMYQGLRTRGVASPNLDLLCQSVQPEQREPS